MNYVERFGLQQPQPTQQAAGALSVHVKEANKREAEQLRAKLLAQPDTSDKPVARSAMPAKQAVTSSQIMVQQQHQQTELETAKASNNTMNTARTVPNTNGLGNDALLAQSKHGALAKNAEVVVTMGAEQPTALPASGQANSNNNHIKQKGDSALQSMTEEHGRAQDTSNLSDSQYADLPAWLEITGYHDVAHRESKLRAYHERCALELEAARIAEKLERLRQAEREAIQSLRVRTPISTPAQDAPPPLPTTMLNRLDAPPIIGTKRTRSPESVAMTEFSRRRQDTGPYGVGEAFDYRPPPPSLSPDPFQRHGRHERHLDTRGRYANEIVEHSRYPSLERWQSSYRQYGANEVGTAPVESSRETKGSTLAAPISRGPRLNYGTATQSSSYSKVRKPRGNAASLRLRKGG